MKKILFVLILCCGLVNAQEKTKKKPVPVLHEISNKELIQSVFPNAAKVDKVNEYWFKVIDEKNKVLGFAMSSMPFCKDVIGYNNTTPVMIITDHKWIVKKVALLTNWESLVYVKKLEEKGFFDLWNNKNLKEAQKVELDAYTGATTTAKAIMKNLQFLLVNGTMNKPNKI